MTPRTGAVLRLGAAAALALLLLIGCARLSAIAQDAAEKATDNNSLVVGTLRAPPFVLRGDDGVWSGLSIELWKRIAAELKLQAEFRAFDYDFEGLLDAVEKGQVDAAIGTIPVTAENEARFDFSHPYFAAGLGIAVRTEPQSSLLATLSGFFTYQMLATIAGLLALLFVVGSLIWLLERRGGQSQFDRRPLRGIQDGVWWAAVTMTTTGYGDKIPLSWPGRLLALIWMFASIFCISLFSASLASSFVVNKLRTGVTGPHDLPRARIAAVSGSAGEQWLVQQGYAFRSYPFVIQASKALQRGEVDALIYERAIVGHMIKDYGWRELRILPHILAVWDYAVAVPTDSPLKERINRALLKAVPTQDWKDVVQKYVGAADSARSNER
jgi:ABC-type amino acid transport substrate-binding protein